MSSFFAKYWPNWQTFSLTPTDKTIEQTLKRGTKVKGGIIGFSKSQITVQRLILTAHERASSTRNLTSMIGMRCKGNEVRADNTTSRIYRDENYVNKVIQVIKRWRNPFEDVSEFVCLSSGLTVGDDIVQGVLGAKKIAETAARDFINKRLSPMKWDFMKLYQREAQNCRVCKLEKICGGSREKRNFESR